MNATTKKISLFACLTIVSVALVGCEKKEGGGESSTNTVAKSQSKPIVVSSEGIAMDAKLKMAGLLAAADAVDGTVDRVVSKCAGCALGMNGKSDDTIKYEGYTMNFCAAGCRDHFNEDFKKSVLAMTVPGK